MNARRGRFLTFEGIDGAGKSTHVGWVAQRLQARGLEVVVTREPGGTPLGERLRELMLGTPMSADTETLLMFAARREHVGLCIEPALARGAWVVCDRFTDSTYAYQGGGRGVPLPWIERLEQQVLGSFAPDRTFLFHLPPDEAARRRGTARAADRFEAEDLAFFERVDAAYAARRAAAPGRFLVIDGRQVIGEVRASLAIDLDAIVEQSMT